MQSFKIIMIGAAVAGLSGCVINTGGTDTNLTLSTLSNGTTDSSSGTDSSGTDSSGTDSSGTDGTDSTGTDSTGAPTTGAPTTSTTTSTTTTTGGALCGWNPAEMYYQCGVEGEDPDGTYPITCPDGLVEGAPCSDTGLTGQGCCDADGNNWYCGMGDTDIVVLEACS